MPAASSPNPSSAAEHSIPSLAMPRILRRPISRPSGMVAPMVARGTTSPASMLNAPHHTCSGAPSPASTKTSWTRSASGWRRVSSTLAVTTPGIGAPTRVIPSTAMPSSFMVSAMRSTSSPSGAISLSQESRMSTARPQNCSMKRMSFTNMSRRSATP